MPCCLAIAAKQQGIGYQVVEQGALVNAIYNFPPQMVFFTTPELLEIGGLPFVSPYEKPTRAEALRYYRRVVDAFDLQIAFEEKVLSVSRETDDGAELFAVETRSMRGMAPSTGSGGAERGEHRRVRHGRFVALAIGYYDHPNGLNVPGEDLPNGFHYYG